MKCINPLCAVEHSNPKFCSRSCAVTVNNRRYPKRVATDREADCVVCGLSLKGRTGKRYCSYHCQQKFLYQQFIDEWLRGVGGSTHNVSGYVRRYLWTIQKGCCTICGLSEWLGKPIGLICDHINGNPNDHNPSNLRLVCSNCDMQLPTYKSRNMRNGRHYRRLRYATGQSY